MPLATSSHRFTRGFRRSGFTSIELIVTIAIIAVIHGLLLPALFVVRDRQAHAIAASVVAQLHLAVQIYADEDQLHRFPPHGPVGDRSLRSANSISKER